MRCFHKAHPSLRTHAPSHTPPAQVLSSSASSASITRQLFAAEGLRGFARGMGARVLTMSGGSTISWFVYEMVKKQLMARAKERGGCAGGAG